MTIQRIKWALPMLLAVAACVPDDDGPRRLDPPETCGEPLVEPHAPTVVMLVDRSGSMTDPFESRQRWDVLYDALMSSTDGVVKPLENDVRFGLSLFSGFSTCPMMTHVPAKLSNYAMMDSIYSKEAPNGNTPTGAAITTVTDYLVSMDVQGSKLILLATDGEPNTCASASEDGKAEAIQAAQAAHAEGIKVVILAVGSDVSNGHQQDMANAGAGLPVPAQCPPCAPTYQPTSQQSMIEEITDIVEAERNCLFELRNASLDPAQAGAGMVVLAGNSLGYDDPDGWQLNTPTEIELLGEACETVREGGTEPLAFDFPCEAFSEAPPSRSWR